MFKLRYYQEEALDAIAREHEKGVTKQLIVLPTGAGKTVIFSHLPQKMPDMAPMLVLAHREELLHQAKAKIEAVNPELTVAIEQGQNYAGHVDVVVASVPTLGRDGSPRLSQFDPDYFKSVIVDEAHHAAATTYRRVLEYFHDALHVGVTATPRRGDNIGLSEIFDEIVYAKSLEDLIEDGFLSPLVGYRLNSPVDLSEVKIVRGDYAEGDLARAVNTDARNEAIVEAYSRYGEEGLRKALVFCVDVAHAQSVAQHFQAHGIKAHAVYGAMPNEERRALLEAHDRGDFKVLTNCQLATEGYDSPSIDMVIMARPTQSTSLYTQCVGRGLRLHPGKEDCLVIDVADVSKTRRPVSLPSLLGLPLDFDLDGNSATEAAKQFKKIADASASITLYIKSLEDIEAGWEKINLFTPPPLNEALLEYSNLIWMELGEDHYVLNFDQNDSVHIEADALGDWHVRTPAATRTYWEDATEGDSGWLKMEKTEEVPAAIHSFKEMSEAFRFADRWAKECRSDKLGFLKADAKWRNDPPSEKQIKVLRKHNIPWEHLTKGQASQVLDKIFAANPKPARPAWLERKIEAERMARRKF